MDTLQLLDVMISIRMLLAKGIKSNLAWGISPVVVKNLMPRILSKML